MAEVFSLFVSYQQVAVFNQSLDSPFNDWEPRHVSQGFSWRPDSVSFRVPEGENYLVEILQNDEESMFTGEPTRIILTPFECLNNDFVAVGSITEENKITIVEAEKFQLIFELLPSGIYEGEKFENGIRLRFIKDDSPMFEIQKADSEMDVSLPLNLVARPAE
ncbi:competence protein ComJ [Agrobacterium sp. BA1120]|uniref:competence protein ComJ n=1 Tax=Agrobacterium sp. BA1120 TaxID=3228927 RepID=UPI00336A47A4